MHTCCRNILDVRNQPISFNIVKAEPAGRISPFGGLASTSAGNFSLQSVRSSSQPHGSMQALRYIDNPNQNYKVDVQIKVRTWKENRRLIYIYEY